MSDSTGLIVASFLGVMGVFVVFYLSKLINDLGDQIALGFIGDRPVPTKQRWLMLYNTWVSYALGRVALTVFIALAMVQIADYVDDAGAKGLAYLGALIAGVGAVASLVQGLTTFFNYRSILRQAEAD